MRRRTPTVIAAAALVLAAAPAADARVRSAIFYYPWYGMPARDGAYQHWHQNGMRPPRAIASGFYPARGVYSSGDRRVVAAQMAEIRRAGVDQVVVSWWGRGSVEDRRLRTVVSAARARGLAVGVHLEPYGGRSIASVEADLAHLRALGIRDIYVYAPQSSPAEWAALNERVQGQRVFAQTGLVGFAAAGRFHGVYTYDIVTHGGDKLRRYCEQARRAGLACAPSVGPGYHARRAVGDRRVKPRRQGRTYDAMWRAALAAGADIVTITSYNEWHEGTQIEPARRRPVGGGPRYLDYEGAWGKSGAAAGRAYLDRTGFWTARLRARTR
jgi:glycoprotein endo-alpha-1,2-mannosidase